MEGPPMPHRPRRSVLYMPASNPRAVEKARTLACDVVILDLEDAVRPTPSRLPAPRRWRPSRPAGSAAASW